ncbi:MAG: YbhN family protein [Planctomycetota bacterium]
MKSSSKLRAVLARLRPLFAIVLLAIVAYNVPWRDRLVWRAGGERAVGAEVAGEIVGDWRGDAVAFRLAPGFVIPAEWPAESASALARGEALSVTRAGAASGFEWRPGMLRVFRELDPRGLVVAAALILCGVFVSITRWWRLLHVAGCDARWTTAARLSFLGLFFNLVVPGLTGGDVIKAVLVVRENPLRRADALVSVIVDRVLGLIVLMGLATTVVLSSGERFGDLRFAVSCAFAAMVVGPWTVLHPWPRRVLRIERWIDRLPMAEKVKSLDRALRIYAQHPWEMLGATILSAFNHLSVAAAVMALGHAFGDTLDFFDYLGVSSIANAVSSVPIAPGGWGVGEAAFGSIFHVLGAAATLGVAVSVTYRLMMMGIGLLGGIFLLLPSGASVRRDLAESEVEGV